MSNVNPSHYQGHKVSPIDLIDAYALDFARGNVIKYVARANEKNGREDDLKALWYLLFALGLPKDTCVALTEAITQHLKDLEDGSVGGVLMVHATNTRQREGA